MFDSYHIVDVLMQLSEGTMVLHWWWGGGGREGGEGILQDDLVLSTDLIL